MKKILLLALCLCCLFGQDLSARTGSAAPQEAAGGLGDTNGNGFVGISDVVTIVNHILDLPVECWYEANGDINNDGAVTASDITSIVDIILNNRSYTCEEAKSITKIPDRLICDNFTGEAGENIMNVYLDNSMGFFCLQAEVEIPEGMVVSDVKAGPRAGRHQVLHNFTDRGTVKILMVSFKNDPFEETDEPLFTIEAKATGNCGNLNIRDIIAANSDYNNYELGFAGGLNDSNTAGLQSAGAPEITITPASDGAEIRNATGQTITVYTIGGEHIKTVVAAADYERIRLSRGVYIITAGNKTAKIII